MTLSVPPSSGRADTECHAPPPQDETASLFLDRFGGIGFRRTPLIHRSDPSPLFPMGQDLPDRSLSIWLRQVISKRMPTWIVNVDGAVHWIMSIREQAIKGEPQCGEGTKHCHCLPSLSIRGAPPSRPSCSTHHAARRAPRISMRTDLRLPADHGHRAWLCPH